VVDFEVLEPANIEFPDRVGKLIILDRAPVTPDVFHKDNVKGLSREGLYIVDTIISNNLINGLKEVLDESPIDRFKDPVMLVEKRTDTTNLEDLFLTKREVSEYCQQFKADAIISLELYKMHLDEDVIGDGYSYWTHYYIVSNEIHWNIYLPDSPRPFDVYKTIDTLYFTDLLDLEVQSIPDPSGMVREISLLSGKKYGRYLVPVWTHTSRLIYKGRGDSLKMASKYTDQGEWDLAFPIWRELLQSQDSTMVSKAYFNMAVYYELEDNLDSAEMLAGMALRYDTLETIREYHEELETRLQNRNKVLRQVH
jgi:hypothetical protein